MGGKIRNCRVNPVAAPVVLSLATTYSSNAIPLTGVVQLALSSLRSFSHHIAKVTEEGGVVISGRSDAVLNPGGVRIGTAEIYRQASGAICDMRTRESARC